MLREAQSFLSLNPWFAVFPGGAIALTVLGLNLLGDGLRDLIDPEDGVSATERIWWGIRFTDGWREPKKN